MISFNYVNMSGVELFNQRGRKASESPNKWLVKTFMTHRTLILRLVVWRSWVMTQRIGILKFLFEISGSALNFGLFLPPTTLRGTFCSCSGRQICWIIKNLITGAQKYPTQAIRTWWEVCLMWEKCWSLWEVWSLINTVRKRSLYDMVTNLFPQILFDAFNF